MTTTTKAKRARYHIMRAEICDLPHRHLVALYYRPNGLSYPERKAVADVLWQVHRWRRT